MSKRLRNARRFGALIIRMGLLLALGAAATGCAPDAFSNRQATGFNAYLDTIAANCRPLMIGSSDIGEWLFNKGSSDPNYSYFLDMTSRLYFGAVSRDAYRAGISGFLGPGSSNAPTFACMFRNLPVQQPNAPAG
jgi:hypothetical protein